jgi:hypothetical protein
MCAHRAGLVADQTRIKNRIQSLLAQRLIPIPVRPFSMDTAETGFPI